MNIYRTFMRFSHATHQRRRLIPSVQGGFSLVEVTLAIGIVAFAFVALFALLPTGMSTFRLAMDTSTTSQIMQRIVSDLRETDFPALTKSPTREVGEFYVMAPRFFDDQGNEIAGDLFGDPMAPTSSERAKHFVIYDARVRLSKPGDLRPVKHQTKFFTSLPSKSGAGTSGKRFNQRFMTIATVEIMTNPGGKDINAAVDGTSQLLLKPKLRELNLSVQTFSAVIARDDYSQFSL